MKAREFRCPTCGKTARSGSTPHHKHDGAWVPFELAVADQPAEKPAGRRGRRPKAADVVEAGPDEGAEED